MNNELRDIGQLAKDAKRFNNFVDGSLNSSVNKERKEEYKQPPLPKPTHQNQLSLDGTQNIRGRIA